MLSTLCTDNSKKGWPATVFSSFFFRHQMDRQLERFDVRETLTSYRFFLYFIKLYILKAHEVRQWHHSPEGPVLLHNTQTLLQAPHSTAPNGLSLCLSAVHKHTDLFKSKIIWVILWKRLLTFIACTLIGEICMVTQLIRSNTISCRSALFVILLLDQCWF